VLSRPVPRVLGWLAGIDRRPWSANRPQPMRSAKDLVQTGWLPPGTLLSLQSEAEYLEILTRVALEIEDA
jgi:hypothetical protein